MNRLTQRWSAHNYRRPVTFQFRFTNLTYRLNLNRVITMRLDNEIRLEVDYVSTHALESFKSVLLKDDSATVDAKVINSPALWCFVAFLY
jgi:hypothetical protein